MAGKADRWSARYGWAPRCRRQLGTKNAASNQYAVWTADSSGNFVSSTGAIDGANATLEGYENTLHQDLNGDGTIGIVATTASASQAPLVSAVNNDTFVFLPGDETQGIKNTASATMMQVDVFPSTAGNQFVSFFHDAQSGQPQVHFQARNYNFNTVTIPGHLDGRPRQIFI